VAFAQDLPSSPGSEAPFFTELPVIITATRLAQRPQDAPAATFIIDREMIEASGAREIADLFRLAPGFLVGSEDTYRRTVGYHGFVDEFGRRLQVLVDGRSVYMPFYGGLAWSDLPLAIDDIDRIEVVRGPNSATHGANAFNGVVNIISKHPDASQGVYMHVAGGDPEYLKGVFRQGLSRGALALRYTLGHEQDEGFTDHLLYGDDDAKKLNLATFDATYDISQQNRLRLQAGVKSGDLNVGRLQSPGVIDADSPPRIAETESRFAQVDLEHDISRDQQLSFLAYAQKLDVEDDYPTIIDPSHPENPFGTPVLAGFSNTRTEERYAIEVKHLMVPTELLRLVWGFELRSDEVDSPGWFGENNPVDDQMERVFANVEWRPEPSWTVNAGFMYESHDIAENDFSPRIAVNFSPTEYHTLRLSASRSVRTPSMIEARWDQYFPLDLDQTPFGGPGIDGTADLIYQLGKSREVPGNETLEAYELGWMFWNPKRWPVRGDVKLFYERYEGLLQHEDYALLTRSDLAVCDPSINPVPAKLGINCNINPGPLDYFGPADSVAEAYTNQVDVDLYGFESSLEWRPTPKARLIGAYSFTKMRNRVFTKPDLLSYPARDGSGGTHLEDHERTIDDSVPTHILSLLGIVNLGSDTTLSAMLYHVGEMNYLEEGDDVDGFTRLDLKLARRFRLSDAWNAEAYGVIQNLGDRYADFYATNQFDTRVFVGIKLYQYPNLRLEMPGYLPGSQLIT
jgi:iron complex outermembrane receptor protein